METVLHGRPLAFGDTQQIATIKSIRAANAISEEDEKLLESGELKRFEVTVSIEATYKDTVLARSPEEAKEKASESIDFNDLSEFDDVDRDVCCRHVAE